MYENLEEKIKRILSLRQKIEAQLVLQQVAHEYRHDTFESIQKKEIEKLYCLKKGIDGLLLLVSEEERYILEMHLVAGMKWESVIEDYEKRWTYDKGIDKRSYIYRQQTAIKKIASYIRRYAKQIDFSWMDDPVFNACKKM